MTNWDITAARRIAAAVKLFSDAGETESQIFARIDRIAENWRLSKHRARQAARAALRLWKVQRVD
jgi:hypothetical protein